MSLKSLIVYRVAKATYLYLQSKQFSLLVFVENDCLMGSESLRYKWKYLSYFFTKYCGWVGGLLRIIIYSLIYNQHRYNGPSGSSSAKSVREYAQSVRQNSEDPNLYVVTVQIFTLPLDSQIAYSSSVDPREVRI